MIMYNFAFFITVLTSIFFQNVLFLQVDKTIMQTTKYLSQNKNNKALS